MKIAAYLISALLVLPVAAQADDNGHTKTPAEAVAVVVPGPDQKVGGVVTFSEVDGGVKVVAHITGLPADSEHGFHIHEFGDARSSDMMTTGGHYNPWGASHGGPHTEEHHAGDLGNLKTDANGVAKKEVVMKGISIAGKNPILGRAIIVHAKRDDLKTNPAGDAGPRIAYGVIGIAQPKQE